MRDADGALLPAGRRARRGTASTPVVLAEKEGLALINGTDGMLGMLVLALADLRPLLTTADIAAAMSVEGLLGTDARLRRRPAGAAPAPGPGRRPRPTCGRCSPAQPDRGQPPRPGRAPASRTPTRCAARPRSPARARDTVEHAAHGRRARAGRRHRQPGRHARRPGRVQRQLPRRPGRLRAGLPRHRRRRPGQHRRAAHRPVPGRRAQPRPARRSSPTTPASTPGT